MEHMAFRTNINHGKWLAIAMVWLRQCPLWTRLFYIEITQWPAAQTLLPPINNNMKRCIHNQLFWGRVTCICVSKLTIIGSDNGLSPRRRQAIIWSNAGMLLIGTIGTNFSEILNEFHTFSFKKMHLKMSSGKWRPFCLNMLWQYFKKNVP